MREARAGGGIGYIPAIDGLRALAVTSVIVFHLWPQALPGGYTGVDVFFVISGFVVTGSMLGRQFETLGALSAWFYARRLMRIMPALVVMLLAAIVATNLFIPGAWLSRALPTSGTAAFFGLSNVALAIDADTYFGPQAAFNPFTHTWSLGVEEQFYLLFPLLIHWHQRAKGERISERRMLGLVAGIAGASLAISAAMLMAPHPLAFYLIFPRFWELGAGMLLCLTADRWQPRLAAMAPASAGGLAGLGAAAIAAGFAIAESRAFPFPLALLPVAGTAMLIAIIVARPASPVARLFALAPVVAVGRLSYSLYLWHWPVFVLFRWTCGLDTLPLQLLALGIACALATASYVLVEKPLRASPRIAAKPRGRVVAGALAIVAVAAVAGWTLFAIHDRITLSVTRDHRTWYADEGRPPDPARVHCKVREASAFFHGAREITWQPSGCTMRPAGFALYAIGDSHNTAYAPAYRQLAAELGVPVHSWTAKGCTYMPINAVMPVHARCRDFFRAVTARVGAVAHRGDVIFLPGLRVQRFVNQFQGDRDIRHEIPAIVTPATVAEARSMLAELASGGAAILIEAPKPIFRSPTFRCADWFNRANPICRGLTVPRAEEIALRKPVVDAMAALATQQPGVRVWDPLPLLCPGAICEAMPGGRPLFFDGDHLSGAGNDLLYPALRDALLAAHR